MYFLGTKTQRTDCTVPVHVKWAWACNDQKPNIAQLWYRWQRSMDTRHGRWWVCYSTSRPCSGNAEKKSQAPVPSHTVADLFKLCACPSCAVVQQTNRVPVCGHACRSPSTRQYWQGNQYMACAAGWLLLTTVAVSAINNGWLCFSCACLFCNAICLPFPSYHP